MMFQLIRKLNSRLLILSTGFLLCLALSWAAPEYASATHTAASSQQTIPPASSIVSDDFNRCTLGNAPWEFIDPVGDSTMTMLGEELEIAVPEGSTHDIWLDGNNAARIMQPATDSDFEVDVKFASLVEEAYQLQGILVEEDDKNFLRINVQHDGIATFLVIIKFVDGVPSAPILEPVAGNAPIFLRLLRWKSLDLWRVSYSYDGQNWNTNANLELMHPLAVTKVGAFIGNAALGANPAPAFTGLIDYFFNRANPISLEDSTANQLDIAVVGGGQIERDKSCGTPVTLTAKADPGWEFQGWSGALNGATDVQIVNLPVSGTITATFVRKPFEVAVTINGDGQVALSPFQEFYDPGDVVTLTATPSPGWVFTGWSGDVTEESATASLTVSTNHQVTALFNPTAGGNSDIQSDDFNQCVLDTSIWDFVDPTSDAAFVANGEQLEIAVPEGNAHDIWANGIEAPYIKQSVSNTDFGIEVKYDSVVDTKVQMQGILILQDAANLLRFNFQHDGTGTFLAAVWLVNGVPNLLAYEPVAANTPMWMRVIRTADTWVVFHSSDGANWSSAPSLQITHPLSVAEVGAFVGNAVIGAGEVPAHSGKLDYFFNMALPISPEDEDANHLPVTIIGSGSVNKNTLCANPVVVQAVADAGWQFTGWAGAATGTSPTETIDFDKGASLTAIFEPLVPTFGLESDVFNACMLNESRWEFVDPQNDAVFRAGNNQYLEIDVPAGSSHDIWFGGRQAPHAMQSVNDTDFELEVKTSSLVSDTIQMQGILIEADVENFLRINTQSTLTDTHFLAISFTDGVPNVLYDQPIDPNTAYTRVDRVGDGWVISGSTDGIAWNELTNFTHTLVVSKVGLFAGNAAGNPAFTAQFDYFLNLENPLIDETGSGLFLNVNTVGNGTVGQSPLSNQLICGQQLTLDPVADTGWRFDGWSGSQNGTEVPLNIIIQSSHDITATFVQEVYTLQTSVIGDGVISITPPKSGYVHGDVVTVSATPEPQWTFLEWRGDVTGAADSQTLTITSDRQLTAVFTKPEYQISATVDGEGTVSASKTSGLIFNEAVTLSATPDDGWAFVGWTQDITVQNGGVPFSEELTTTINIQDDTIYFANFALASDSPPDNGPTPDVDNDNNPNGPTVYIPFLFQP